MKKVTGFMTSDGGFFDKEEEAEFAEAEDLLVRHLHEQRLKSTDRFLELLVNSATAVRRYLNAYEAVNHGTPPRDAPESTGGDDIGEGAYIDAQGDLDQEDDASAEDEAEGVFELPPGVREPVPDVGRHIKPTPIRQQRPVNGPRGRRSNASSVRDD
jgi:hypothetical protein